MDNKKKTLIITGVGVGVALLLFVAIAIFGMFRGFNSEKYVSAVLNQTFKGEVENKTGSLLPSTGGIGTTIFYIVGITLMLGAAIVLISKKRMASFA